MAKSDRTIESSTFRLSKLLMTNYKGREVDLLALVDNFTITESIYSMYASYEFIIVDAVAVLEKYIVTGNEKIQLEMVKRDDNTDGDKQIVKYLVLAGISDYARPSNEGQAYKLKCISETSMSSANKRVSRAVKGSACKIISDLYNEIQYNLPLNALDIDDEGNYQIILPNRSYTDTFQMLLKKAQRSNGNIFHMYESLWHKQIITSYEEIVKRTPIEEYKMKNGETTKHQTEENYVDNKTKITNLSSKFGVSHYDSFKRGAFSAKVHDLDISNKSYNITDFNLNSVNTPKIDKDFMLSANYTVGGNGVEELGEASHYGVHRNSMSFANSIDNMSNKSALSIAKRKMTFENQYAINHKITIGGDTRIRAGEVVNIWIPQSTDPENTTEHKDLLLSGKYFIATAVHRFDKLGKYVVDLHIKKDSIDRKSIEGKYDKLDG